MKRGLSLGTSCVSRLALAAAFVLAAAAPSPARAEGTELVLSLGAGVYVPTRDNGFIVYDPAVFGGAGLAVDTLRPGVDLEVALSAWWGVFGAQLLTGYLASSWEQTSVGTVPVTALLRVRLPLRSFAPFLEGGGGVAFTSTTTLVAPGPGGGAVPTLASFGATTLEWVAGVGAELALGSLRVGASVRYLWFDRNAPSATSSPPIGSGSASTRFAIDGLTATVGVGYRLPLGGE